MSRIRTNLERNSDFLPKLRLHGRGLLPLQPPAPLAVARRAQKVKKQTIQFLYSFNLYFQQKKASKLSIIHMLMKSSVEFMTSQTGKTTSLFLTLS